MKFVRGVYAEFKRRGSPTVVMGASFRSTAQIEALAGCDRLTISPDLLEKLDADHGELPRKLVAGAADGTAVTPIDAAKFAADLARSDGHREAGDRHRCVCQGSGSAARAHSFGTVRISANG